MVFPLCSSCWSVTKKPILKTIVAVINVNLYVCSNFSRQQIKLFFLSQAINASHVCIAWCYLKALSRQCFSSYIDFRGKKKVFYNLHFHLLLQINSTVCFKQLFWSNFFIVVAKKKSSSSLLFNCPQFYIIVGISTRFCHSILPEIIFHLKLVCSQLWISD